MTYDAWKIGYELPKIYHADEDFGLHPRKVEPRWTVDEGRLIVSAEEPDTAADYYGEYRGNDPWINPDLETWAEDRECYWEWVNPGAIVLVEDW